MSAPPMDQAQYQQGMPAAPPSYDDSMAAGGAGGFAPPPPPGQMYPGLPGKEGAPPPPASYPAPQQPQAPVQVVTQVQYVAAPSFGYRPVTMTCPHCQAHVTTKTQSEPSVVAWIVGGLLCFVGFWPCACIPCCVDSMQQVTHSCPSCGNFLGRYKGGLWVWTPTEGKGYPTQKVLLWAHTWHIYYFCLATSTIALVFIFIKISIYHVQNLFSDCKRISVVMLFSPILFRAYILGFTCKGPKIWYI